MMMKSIFLCFFISFNTFAEVSRVMVQDPGEYKIDWKYFGGEYLIYECKSKHYACVSFDGNEYCREQRKLAIEKAESHYPCAPLGKMPDKKACIEKTYKMTDLNIVKKFCFKKIGL